MSNMRTEMPHVAAFVDEMRAVFGADMVNEQIRQGLKGQPTFWARENGHELGTRWEHGGNNEAD